MALKPTIYRLDLTVSDFDRDYYQTHTQTLAQHPSESVERMLARVLAFSLNADDQLHYGRGLSNVDEPDLWLLRDEQIVLWLDVGEPSFDRLKKACRRAGSVKVYSFNSKSDVWWQQLCKEPALASLQVFQFDWSQIQALADKMPRTAELMISISAGQLTVGLGGDFVELTCRPLERL